MNKRGMTLVEIIVAIAIVGIISTVIASVFIFGNKSYNRSETRSIRQMDVRLVAQTISKELRYAYAIELLDNKNFEDDYEYIYFDEPGKKVMIINEANEEVELLNGKQTFDEVKFIVKEGLLKVSVESQNISLENNYKLNATISLLNQKELDENEGSKVIKYKKYDNKD